jgi:NAD+ diphosphatase
MLGFTASAAPDARPRPSEELEDVRWFSRAAIAAGEILLPPPTSISHRLIAHWFDAHGSEPLAAITARSGPWYGRGGGPR